MNLELRMNEATFTSLDNGTMVVSGYVNETEKPSQILGSHKKFIEKISSGAFKRAIENKKNEIDFLAEHDSNKILASTRNNTLTLQEDEKGLFMTATITPTSWGKDYYELIKSGILRNMSFGFRTIKDEWKSLSANLFERTVNELELFEVSVVREPAYSQSTIMARGINLIEDVDIPENILKENNTTTERGTNMEKILNRSNNFENELRTLNTTTNGQALIPENVQGEIVKRMEDISPAFLNARKLPSVNGELKVARENDEVTGGFFGEGESILEESIAFEYATLKQKRVGAAISLSNQLVNDSAIDIVSYINDLISRRLAKTVEKAIFVGNGVEEFSGIVNDPKVEKVEVSQAITIDTLTELYTSLHPDFLDNSAFYMTRPMFTQIAKFKDGNGHSYLQNGIVNGKLTYTLFGIPIYITKALTNENPIVLGNLGEAYSILVKQEMQIRQIVDGPNALRGSQLLVADSYMDGTVTNPQAVVKLAVIA